MWLQIRKRDTNTQWLAGALARLAGVAKREVGYAGLKDRAAVTSQWFSVPIEGRREPDWTEIASSEVELLRVARGRKKIRRGVQTGNRFQLRVQDYRGDPQSLQARVDALVSGGVPNYFGEQRFGHGGSNVDLGRSLFAGRRLTRNKRSIALSAARSFLFNEILDARVRDGSWERILPGEQANLDGSGSVFAVDEVTSELEQRCAAYDIHPTATLWGRQAPRGTQSVAALENRVTAPHSDLCEGLVAAGLEAATRPLRLRVQDLRWQFEDDALWLEFQLPKGAFATTVLREIAAVL